MPKPSCASADGDHVQRVTGRVVQVASDAGALLGDGQLPLAGGVLLGADGAPAEVGDLLAAQPGPFAREPCRGAGKAGVDDVAAGETDHGDSGAEAGDEEYRDQSGTSGSPWCGFVAAAREQVERCGGPQRWPDDTAEDGEEHTRRRSQREDTQRRAPPAKQRYGRRRRERGSDGIETTRSGMSKAEATTMSEQRQRAR
jgi:hypothetical protein